MYALEWMYEIIYITASLHAISVWGRLVHCFKRFCIVYGEFMLFLSWWYLSVKPRWPPTGFEWTTRDTMFHSIWKLSQTMKANKVLRGTLY